MPRGARKGAGQARIIGDLASLSLAEIMQMLTLGTRTARVSLDGGGGPARLWIVNGSATHAEAGSLTGEPALYQMLTRTRGRFVIEDGLTTAAQTLHGDTMLLVLEGMRRLDESRDGAPPATAAPPSSVPDTEDASGEAARPRRRGRVVASVAAALAGIVLLAALAVGIFPASGDPGAEPQPPIAPTSARSAAHPPSPPPGEDPLVAERPAFWLAVLPVEPAPPSPAAAGPEPPDEPTGVESDAPPEIVDAEPADLTPIHPEPVLVEALPVELPVSIQPAYLDLEVRSSVKSGTLVVWVDGDPAITRPLESPTKSVKRWLNKLGGVADETFDATIEIEPGTHALVARLEREGKANHDERRIEITVEPGGRRTVLLSAARGLGKRLSLAVVEPTGDGDVAR